MIRYFLIFAASIPVFSECSTWADEAVLPGSGFAVSRYQALWTKSPFSVASPEAVTSSPDYSLVGLSRFDGISYASLIEKQTQEHFLLTSDKPVKGLTLVSVSQGHGAGNSSAVVQRGAESLTLKLEQVAFTPPPNPVNGIPAAASNLIGSNVSGSAVPQIPMPGTVPQIPMPGSGPAPGMAPGVAPPPAAFHRRPIHIPPPPSAPSQNQKP